MNSDLMTTYQKISVFSPGEYYFKEESIISKNKILRGSNTKKNMIHSIHIELHYQTRVIMSSVCKTSRHFHSHLLFSLSLLSPSLPILPPKICSA